MARTIVDEFWSFPPEPGDLDTFRLGSGDLGVLLIHGFCGTPPEMRPLGEHLAAHGFNVHGALIAGHGTNPEDHDRTTSQDWIDSVQAQLDDLRKESSQVFVAGQSMGGALALCLAARNPDIRAIATTAALVRLPRRTKWLINFARLIRHRWHSPNPGSVDLWDKDAVRKLRSYTRRSMKSHGDLLRIMRDATRSARQVRVPALVMHGLRDATVPPANARMIADLVGPTATLRYFERSGHAMTVDVDHEEVFELVTEHFLRAADAGSRVAGPNEVATGAAVARA